MIPLPDHPVFVALEGIDGAGKSTLAHAVAARMRQAGRAVIETSEPSRRSFASQGRTHLERLTLMTVDRAVHSDWIDRHLHEGRDVICDRYWWSSAAYQLCAEADEIWRAQALAFLPPHLWVRLKPRRSLCRRRVEARGEHFPVQYMARVEARYERTRHLASPLLEIDSGKLGVAECVEEILGAISRLTAPRVVDAA